MLICGSLEPGRDGVGDYCRRLAGELATRGTNCLLLGFYDHAVGSETPEAPHPSIQIVRLSAQMPLSKRAARTASLLADWKPDWVSLQFVSYAFNQKGLPFAELFWLPLLLRHRKLHIMLHELWVGLGVMKSLKNKILGGIQRWMLLTLLHRLRAIVLHTSNQYYCTVLRRNGVEASTLPLFGNIPVFTDSARHWLADAVMCGGGPDISRDRDQLWLLGIFGSIPPDWPSDHFFGRLSGLARAAGRHAVIISAGVTGADATSRIEAWRVGYRDIDFVAIGPRSALELSQFFNSIDFGITPHPIYLLGKSGTVAAMLEHGLPLIATWGDIAPELPAISPPSEPLIWRDDGTLSERLQTAHMRHRRPDWCATVAQMFLSSLSKAASTIR